LIFVSRARHELCLDQAQKLKVQFSKRSQADNTTTTKIRTTASPVKRNKKKNKKNNNNNNIRSRRSRRRRIARQSAIRRHSGCSLALPVLPTLQDL